MSKINDMNIELNRLFDLFNEKYFNNTLPKTVLAIHTNGNNSRMMGWFTPYKVWKDELDKKYFHEIAVSAEYVYRGYDEICSTLIHEMVHLHCHVNDIKDTSRNGSYHNKRFKVEAEKRGLIIGYDKRIGHSPTTLADETIKYIESIRNEAVFELTRINHKSFDSDTETEDTEQGIDTDDDGAKRSHSRKYTCSECSMTVRATKAVNVICGDCMVTMSCPEDVSDID